MSDGAAGPVRRSGVALALVTAAFSAMLLSANLATPLYAVWARQFGFSTAVLALIFAVYALVLIPALLLFGQLSDRLGRRAVIGLGLGLAAVRPGLLRAGDRGGMAVRRPGRAQRSAGHAQRGGRLGAVVRARDRRSAVRRAARPAAPGAKRDPRRVHPDRASGSG